MLAVVRPFRHACALLPSCRPSVSIIPSTLSSPDMRCLIFAADFRSLVPHLCASAHHNPPSPFFSRYLILVIPGANLSPSPLEPPNPGATLSRHNWHSFSLAATSCVTFLLALCINFSSLPRALISVERSILCHVPSVHSLGRHPQYTTSTVDKIQRDILYILYFSGQKGKERGSRGWTRYLHSGVYAGPKRG